jgi:hypothetical protein
VTIANEAAIEAALVGRPILATTHATVGSGSRSLGGWTHSRQAEPAAPYSLVLPAVDQERGTRADSFHDGGGRDRDERLVRHQNQAGIADDAALMDRPAVRPHVSGDGRAPPLRAVPRGVLDLESRQEEGRAQNAAGGLHPLAAPAMETDPEHGGASF